MNLRQRGNGRPPDLGRIQLPRLYTTARTINDAKTADLLSLFDFIPPLYHGFYNTLLASSTDVEDNRDSEQSDCEPSNSEPSDNEDSDQEEHEGEESEQEEESDNEQELEPDESSESD